MFEVVVMFPLPRWGDLLNVGPNGPGEKGIAVGNRILVQDGISLPFLSRYCKVQLGV